MKKLKLTSMIVQITEEGLVLIIYPFVFAIVNLKKIKFLISFVILIFIFFSQAEDIKNLKGFDHSPLLSSFGNSGRAASNSAEYHILNAATITLGKTGKFSGFYFFNQKAYGGFLSNAQNIPISFSWIQIQEQNYRNVSIAGVISNQLSVGLGVSHVSQTNEFYPHLGFIYKPISKLTLGFTGDKIKESLVYGSGFHYVFSKNFEAQGDVIYSKKSGDLHDWSFHGGMEFLTQDYFSLRMGWLWPDSSYRMGVTLISKNFKVDYTWIQGIGHSLGFRIESKN